MGEFTFILVYLSENKLNKQLMQPLYFNSYLKYILDFFYRYVCQKKQNVLSWIEQKYCVLVSAWRLHPCCCGGSEKQGMSAAENSHAQHVLSTLNQQRAQGRFCDAMLNLGGGVAYLAHCNILACFSELFQEANMPSAPCMEFSFHECPSDGLELLLDFVYTGELKLDQQNLACVQHAATSLCVPEALALCQQFKETCEEPASPKRRRGRLRKSTQASAPTRSVKDENVPAAFKDEFGRDSAAVGTSTAGTGSTTTMTTTTTRSGRVVKGPRRLVTDENPTSDVTSPEKSSKRPHLIPPVVGAVVVENHIFDQPTSKNEVK